jgi:two-component system sensor histidine kinase CpxA
VRSIFTKILIWFSVTLVVCLAGTWLANRFHGHLGPGHHDFFSRSIAFQASGAEHAYEAGGKAALAEYLARLGRYFPGQHALVDRNGIDLVTGENRSAELAKVGPHWNPEGGGRMVLAWPSRDGQYRMVVDAPSPGVPWSPFPYYLSMGLAVVVFCYILAVHLVSPLRALEQTVERFGRGDFGVRANVQRRDEFGKLARTFNVMADRIETLLKAERRLLLDVSHELRSPLARLEFAVELARSGSGKQESFDRIQREVERLSALVSELLQVTRAEGDFESHQLEEISMPGLLEELTEDCAVESEVHNCRLEVSADAALVVRGDRELLRRAIENVLRNAIRYAPERSAVEITLEQRDGKAITSVRDFGPGVPEESLPNLFKPFFRVEADRNRNSGGVGLGLSIAERAVAVHGGTIRAQNAHPGLRVEIELPALRVASVESARLKPTAAR